MREMRMGSRFENPNNEMLVQRAIALAEQLGGNKLRPELIQKVGEVLDTKDPAAIDAIDPDSVDNQKRMSQQARNNLRRAWEVHQKPSGEK